MNTSTYQLRLYVYVRMKLNVSTADILKELQTVFGEDEEFSEESRLGFEDGREANTGRPRSSRTDENIAKVKAAIEEDRMATFQAISESTAIASTSVHRIIKNDLHLKSVACQWIPHTLSPQHKQQRCELAKEWIKVIN